MFVHEPEAVQAPLRGQGTQMMWHARPAANPSMYTGPQLLETLTINSPKTPHRPLSLSPLYPVFGPVNVKDGSE